MRRRTTKCTAVVQEICNMIEHLLERTRDWVWGLGSVTGYSVVECEGAEKKLPRCEGRVKEHDHSTTVDWCQMVVNHLMRRPVIFADAIARAHTCMHMHAKYSQQGINFAKGPSERGSERDYSLLSRINEPVMNYAFSSRDDSSLSFPAHASIHIQ